VIFTLPHADSWRVSLSVLESRVDDILPGLVASISPVGFGDRVLHGMVEKVNQYAEPTGWRQANVKEYKALVSIFEPTPDLRAGMTAAVTVRCAEVPNAMQVPVQCVYAHGSKFYCFAYSQGSWEAREVKTGPTNDKFFVIERGLNEGDQVAMSPRTYIDKVNLPKLSPEEAQRAVPQRNGRRRGPGGPDGNRGPNSPGGPPSERMPGDLPAEEPLQPGQPDGSDPGDTRLMPQDGAAGHVQTASASSQGTAE
jgi:hypothetical protein